jgi:hypothetical protein
MYSMERVNIIFKASASTILLIQFTIRETTLKWNFTIWNFARINNIWNPAFRNDYIDESVNNLLPLYLIGFDSTTKWVNQLNKLYLIPLSIWEKSITQYFVIWISLDIPLVVLRSILDINNSKAHIDNWTILISYFI